VVQRHGSSKATATGDPRECLLEGGRAPIFRIGSASKSFPVRVWSTYRVNSVDLWVTGSLACNLPWTDSVVRPSVDRTAQLKSPPIQSASPTRDGRIKSIVVAWRTWSRCARIAPQMVGIAATNTRGVEVLAFKRRPRLCNATPQRAPTARRGKAAHPATWTGGPSSVPSRAL
jgi:hypothetical protein